MKTCSRCKIEKPLSEFYFRRGVHTHSYCKPCVNAQTKSRQHNLKSLCVEYKGGKCEDCGGVFHHACYDFHHLDPTQKEFSFGRMRSLTFNEVITSELDKCVLLCSNCHRVRHATY